MRVLNEMFSIEGERLIKTSNGQPVPEDEPIFILRGRDQLSLRTLHLYIRLCVEEGVPQDRIDELRKVEERFAYFMNSSPTMKVPGTTHGA
jgi:hypothetical protein